LHIAQVGTGRVGRPTAYAVMCAGLADTLTVCDVKPGLAAAFAEELKHVTASIGLDAEINSCERDEEVTGAELILISAGEPRTPGVKMSRRDFSPEWEDSEICRRNHCPEKSRGEICCYLEPCGRHGYGL
jgi:malate/lactate dehydrogenase